MEDSINLLSDSDFNQTVVSLLNNSIYTAIDNYEFNSTDIFSANTTIAHRPSVSVLLVFFKILKWLNFYYLGTIVIVGVLGNAFNFFQFLFTRNKLKSPSYYLATLSLADSVFLLTIFVVWIGHFKIKFFMWRGVVKFFVYIGATSSCLSGSFTFHSIPFFFFTN